VAAPTTPAAFVIRAASDIRTKEPCVWSSGCAARYVLRMTKRVA
jgi:hypothetical protein